MAPKPSGKLAADGSGLHPIFASGRQPASQSAGQWTADGKYFLFSGCENYDCNLWGIREAWNWFRRSHLDPVQLTHGLILCTWPSLANGFPRVWLSVFRSNRELQKIEPQSHHAESLILNANAEIASVSPDGHLALYTDRPDGSLWREQRRWLSAPAPKQPPLVASAPHWSRDGKQILFTGVRPGYLRRSIPLRGWRRLARGPSRGPRGRRRRLVADATQIVVSMREKKTQPKFGIYLFQSSTSEWTVLPESRGLVAPRWSPDGRYIAALDETNHRLLLYDFLTEKWSDVAEGGLLGAPFWTSGSSALYFQDQLGSEQAIYRGEHRESPGREGVQLRRDLRSSPPLHLQRAWIGRFSLCDGGARFDGHLRSRLRLTLRIRRFAPAPAFPQLRTEEAKIYPYNVMKCRIPLPCLRYEVPDLRS